MLRVHSLHCAVHGAAFSSSSRAARPKLSRWHHLLHFARIPSLRRNLSLGLCYVGYPARAGTHTSSGQRHLSFHAIYSNLSFTTSITRRPLGSLEGLVHHAMARRSLLSHLLHGLREYEESSHWGCWLGRRLSHIFKRWIGRIWHCVYVRSLLRHSSRRCYTPFRSCQNQTAGWESPRPAATTTIFVVKLIIAASYRTIIVSSSSTFSIAIRLGRTLTQDSVHSQNNSQRRRLPWPIPRNVASYSKSCASVRSHDWKLRGRRKSLCHGRQGLMSRFYQTSLGLVVPVVVALLFFYICTKYQTSGIEHGLRRRSSLIPH